MAIETEAAVELVRDDQGIVQIERGGDVARQALDDDVDLLDVGLDIVRGGETVNRIVRKRLSGHGTLLGAAAARPAIGIPAGH